MKGERGAGGKFVKNIDPERSCSQCASPFSPRLDAQKYCSKRCSEVSMKKNHNRPCIVCGTEFYATSMKTKYCSHQCYGSTLKKQVLSVERECGHCAGSFIIRSTSRRKFCSPGCVREDARTRQAGILPPHLGKSGVDAPGYKHGLTLGENRKAYERIICQRRLARKRNAEGSFSVAEWEALKAKYGFMCLCCKRNEPEISLTVDHIVPLARGGSNYISNIQPLCQSCNSRKSTKTIDYATVTNTSTNT